MDKETGKELEDNGKQVSASVSFVTGPAPEGEVSVSGTVDVAFTFNASSLAGTSVVAFESLFLGKKTVAVHADIEDEGQTVRFPEAETNASDTATDDHDASYGEKIRIRDVVIYKNLLPGKEYTVKGTLMVKETGEPLMENGKPVTAEKTFTAETADGSVELIFTIDSTLLAGKALVAFEEVKYEDITVAVHADIEDEDQTVYVPEIRTSAKGRNSERKVLEVGTKAVLVDTVTYKNLTPGKTYVVKGEVMDKATGKSIGVTAEKKFVPEKPDGTVEVSFTIDTTNLEGKDLVVFERVFDAKGVLVAVHEDLSDKDQTVTVSHTPATGDPSELRIHIVMLAASVAMLLCLWFVFRRKKLS